MDSDNRRRKIKLRLNARNPEDLRSLLTQTQDLINDLSRKKPNRPVDPPDIDLDFRTDERLEMKCHEQTAEVLDQRNQELRRQEDECPGTGEAINNLKVRQTSWTERERAKRASLADWLGGKLKVGWKFVAVVVVDELIRRTTGGGS